MALRFLPLFASAAIHLGTSFPVEAEAGLALEPAPVSSTAPFRPGDHLELTSGSEPNLRVTVLEINHWPWVRARCDQAVQPYETWINFAQVMLAKRLADK